MKKALKTSFLIITCCLTLFFILAGAWAAESKSGNKTTVSGRISTANGGPVFGAVLLEKGRLYGKNFRFGGIADKEGKFKITVDGPGSYGIHVYATGHIYFPLSIELQGGQDNYFEFSLPPNPAVERAPIISDVRFEESSGTAIITLMVSDPDHNLSHQVLALNAATGEAFRMKPPGVVFPWTKVYPEGKYTLAYSSSGRQTNPENWYFVAADIRCYNSPVMKHPFTPESFLPAISTFKESTGSLGRNGKDIFPASEPLAPGTEVFKNNCGICHYPDSTRTKVGPGLKGLFSRKTTPVQKLPVNEKNIRSQIQDGGVNMPPYDYLTDEQLDAIIEYLKSL